MIVNVNASRSRRGQTSVHDRREIVQLELGVQNPRGPMSQKQHKSLFFKRKATFFGTPFASKMEIFHFSNEIQHFWKLVRRFPLLSGTPARRFPYLSTHWLDDFPTYRHACSTNSLLSATSAVRNPCLPSMLERSELAPGFPETKNARFE